MIEHKEGNVLLAEEVTHIVHQANLFHMFGAGIAKQIRELYPEAYAADLKTIKASKSRLGTFSFAPSKGKVIINLYSQKGIGGKDRRTDYAAFAIGLSKICEKLTYYELDRPDPFFNGLNPILGIPYKIGCGLANGDWNVVYPIIEDIFAESPVKVILYQLK